MTELGRKQSAILAAKLSSKGIELLFTSPRLRAQETSAVITEQLGLVAKTLPDFRERNSYGILTGMTKERALEKHPDQVQILRDVYKAVEGAEEYAPFQDRVTLALELLSQESADTVAVVTHGGTIRLIFRDILRLGEIEVDDCAFAVLETVGDTGYQLLEKNGIKIKDK